MTSTSSHAAAFTYLRSIGATKAVAHFAGGNDEGGIEEIRIIGADGETPIPYDYDYDKQTPLDKDADSVVYGEYGSFAGDFSVDGTVTYEVAAGTVTMSKSKRVWSDGGSYEV